ncbi:MAG: hypothetical protein M1827_002428 [Pycnora praestabilis]|nr:MAG: hypothetical protein M1827_002428 [Pycnora praestabilis]
MSTVAEQRPSNQNDRPSDETLDQGNSNGNRLEKPNKQSDDGETGSGGPPQPVGFWDSSLSKVRMEVFGLWLRTTLILAVFILAVLSIYWAVLYHVEENLPSLVVYVVDFDGQLTPYNTGEPPLIGPMMVQTTEMMVASPEPHLGFGSLPPSMFNNDPIAVRQAVFDQKAWASIVINANATALLRAAVAQGNVSYDPLGAIQITYVEARDQDTYGEYIIPSLTTVQTTFSSMFGEMWTKMVLANASDPTILANIQKVPQALNPAVGFSIYNLRPFYPPVVTPAVTVGLICHPPLKFWQLVLWRWLTTILAYFFLSLAYSLISLAFGIPFSNSKVSDTSVAGNSDAYGKGSFVVYWMLNHVGMTALGLACENVAMFVGHPWTAFWLIFWVITNVSTSFYDIDLSPRFYYWGYAWPLHNIVEASRTIIFDTHSRIGLNFAILFAWCAVNSVLFPGACFFMRWETMRGKEKEAESKEK